MKKDKSFLRLVIEGNKDVIIFLKKDKELKSIKDDKGNNIVHYLIAGNQHNLTKELIIEKLISYKVLKSTLKELIKNQNYKNDNYYVFFLLLKEEDKEILIKRDLEFLIKNNNVKTFSTIKIEKAIEFSAMNKIAFEVLTQCSDEMLETCMPLYKSLTFDIMSLKNGFYELRSNKVRTSILMENLNMSISPLLYEELNRVNEYCIVYLENRELYNKLEDKLISKENKKFKKI